MTPLDEVLTKNVDPRAIDAAWERIRARRERPRTLRRIVFVVPALAVAALLVLVVKLFVLAPAAPEPIALVDGTPLPEAWSAPTPKVVMLDDGSKLEIEAATKLRPTTKKTDPARVELMLESGATTFDVKPGGPRMWVIDAGDVVVRVLGTRFTVTRDGANVDVKVERGKVSVEGARVEGGAKLLVAGESIHVGEAPGKHAALDPPVDPKVPAPSPDKAVDRPAEVIAPKTENAPSPPSSIVLPPPRSVVDAPVDRPSEVAAPKTANAPAPPPSTMTQPPAKHAAPADRPSPVEEPAQPAAAPPAPAPAPDAMASADAARRAGRPREAASILSALVDKKDARAPLAAFTLGKIHAEDLGDHATAAIWFERAIAFGLPRGLDEEAQARAVESHAKAGRRTEAARAAARYEASFPSGRHLERVRSFVRH